MTKGVIALTTKTPEDQWEMDAEEREWLLGEKIVHTTIVVYYGGSSNRLREADAMEDARSRPHRYVNRLVFHNYDIMAVDLTRMTVQISPEAEPVFERIIPVSPLIVTLTLPNALDPSSRAWVKQTLESFSEHLIEEVLITQRSRARVNGKRS